MKKRFRHSLGTLSAILIVLVGIFVAVPHGICLGKVVAADACPCAPAASAEEACCCCESPAKSFGCGDLADSSADSENSSSGSDSGFCFSISSDSSQFTGAERAPAPPVFQAVVAVLPLPVEITVGQPAVFPAAMDTALWRDEGSLHQDNCVYRI